ncbi:hypothetical protein COU80_04260 [Candidatus Peregrinibacteria bacterium CG10_big_fil_rev_8_21_14_0_10_55_24]|nr:MAG: hypothetical protein COU80_04260 [Candidatus Peregrinibacteria bacterium CG10_big_fil_rev_8_21_14_0_10_55_24]
MEKRDMEREQYFRKLGFDILRFSNAKAVHELNSIIEGIELALDGSSH